MAHALEPVAVEGAAVLQGADPVGELDLAAAVAGRALQGLEDVGGQDVAPDDGQVARGLLRLGLLHQVPDAVDARVLAGRATPSMTP